MGQAVVEVFVLGDQFVSAIAGEIDIPRTTTTRPTLFLGGHPTTSTHLERRPRLPIGVIAQGTPGQTILLTGATPTTLTLTAWHTQPTIRQLLQPWEWDRA